MQIQEDGSIVVDGKKFFPDSYVHELRDEAARYRTRSSDYEQAFTGLTEDEKGAMLGILNKFSENDPVANAAAALELRELSRLVLGDEQFLEGLTLPTQESNPMSENQNPPAGEVTPDLVAQIVEAVTANVTQSLTAAEQKRQDDAEINRIFDEVRARGFEPDTPEFAMYLKLGQTYHELGIDKSPDDIATEVRSLVPGAAPAPEGNETGGGPVPEGAENELPPNPSTVDAGTVGSGAIAETGNWLTQAQDKQNSGGAGVPDYLAAARAAAENWHNEQD